MTDAPFDAGNPVHVVTGKKRDKDRQSRLDDAMVKLMATQNGRALVWSLLGQCGVFHSSFNLNAAQTAFNEGQRAIGLSVLAHVHRVAAEHYIVMSKEGERNV